MGCNLETAVNKTPKARQAVAVRMFWARARHQAEPERRQYFSAGIQPGQNALGLSI